jgi:hypothetical protein
VATKQIETHLRANMTMTKKDIMISNFLGGLSWGFGTVVGASLVVGILGTLLHQFGLIDLFNNTSNTFRMYR